MKKIAYFISVLTISISVYGIEFNTYGFNKEFEFSASNYRQNGVDDLSVVTSGQTSGSIGPNIYFIGDQLVLSDEASDVLQRTIFLSHDYSFQEIYNETLYRVRSIIKQSNFYIGFNNDSVFVFEINNGLDIVTTLNDYKLPLLRGFKDLYYHDNTLFITDSSNTLWAIKNPGNDLAINKQNLIKEDKIIEDINNGVYSGLTIDSEKRLFFKGELQTISFNRYIDFFKSKGNKFAGSINNFKYDYSTLAKFNMYIYSGKDSDGNSYWSSNRTFMIFDKNGLLLDLFRFDSATADSFPAVSPSGDIYFLNYGSDRVSLYKINRQW